MNEESRTTPLPNPNITSSGLDVGNPSEAKSTNRVNTLAEYYTVPKEFVTSNNISDFKSYLREMLGDVEWEDAVPVEGEWVFMFPADFPYQKLCIKSYHESIVLYRVSAWCKVPGDGDFYTIYEIPEGGKETVFRQIIAESGWLIHPAILKYNWCQEGDPDYPQIVAPFGT